MTDIDDALKRLSLATDKPQRLTLVHYQNRQPLRDIDGNQAWIDLFSNDSEIARKHGREVTRRRLNMRGRGKLTPEELEAENIDLLAALTGGWSLLDLMGEPLPVAFTPENARKVYEAIPWIKEQVEEFVTDRGNYVPPSLRN